MMTALKTLPLLPPYPSMKARSLFPPSQVATLHQTIAARLGQTLALPASQLNSPAICTFLASYAKDAAQRVLHSLVWDEPVQRSTLFITMSQAEKTIRARVLYLGAALASAGVLQLQTLVDLTVAYSRSPTSAKRLRELFASACTSPAFLAQARSEALPAFTALLSAPNSGLHALLKSVHIVLYLLRSAPQPFILIFAHDKSFMLALARAYDHSLSAIAQNYGGFRLDGITDTSRSSRVLDEWERHLLETKVALLDSFNVLVRSLLQDVAHGDGPLPERCEPAFEVLFALLDARPSNSRVEGSGTPFLDRPLIADYQHAYDLTRVLSRTLGNADDARTAVLEAQLRSLDPSTSTSASPAPSANDPTPPSNHTSSPGALKLLLRSSGLAHRPAATKHAPSPPQSVGNKGKEKARAVQEQPDPALDEAVAQVLSILPDTDPAYVRAVLKHPDYPYRGNSEQLIGAILEGTAPDPSQVNLEEGAGGEALQHEEVGPRGTSAKEEFVYTRERRNVWDEEKMDFANVRIGKKQEDASAILQERSAQMKDDILRRVAEMDTVLTISDSEEEPRDGKGKAQDYAFEDELDETGAVKVRDGDESELDGPDDGDDGEDEAPPQNVETILELAYLADPKQFERDGQTRRGKVRAELKTRTGWTDEQIEGWKIMLERNPNKDKILAKHEFSGNKPLPSAPSPAPSTSSTDRGGAGRGGGRGRGGRGGGGGRSRGRGGGGGDGKERAWKDKHKASQANHNRRRGHDKKMAKAGGPS